MILYYFTRSQYAISNIKNQRLRVSRLADLNDPFELMALASSNSQLAEALRLTKQDLDQKLGVLCFSKDWDHPLMWAHYGDRHKGICLGFEVALPDNLIEVEYLESRAQIANFATQKDEIKLSWGRKIYSIKHSVWSYERECRLFVDLTDPEEDNYFFKFNEKMHLSEIIFGINCKEICEYAIPEEFLENGRVKRFKATLSQTTYSIVRHQRD